MISLASDGIDSLTDEAIRASAQNSRAGRFGCGGKFIDAIRDNT